MSDYDEYYDYIKLWLKNYVKENSESSIYMYEYETFNELFIYPLNIQVEKINQEILKFSNLLNSGYPFISYNFKEGIFDEDYYFDMQVIEIIEVLGDTYNIKDFYVLIKQTKSLLSKASKLLEDDNSKFCKVITEIKIDYCRSKYIDALVRKRSELTGTKEKINETFYPHPRIFKSELGFKLFERLKDSVNDRYKLADYSFIYRMMLKDNFIYESIGDSEFRQWLSKNYLVEIDKMKQLHNCTSPKKSELYSSIKDLFQREK